MQSSRTVEVVGAVIHRAGRWLVGQRPAHKAQGGQWEFVGGKVEPGETPAQALARECREELGVEVEPGAVVGSVVHAYPEKTVHLMFMACTLRADAEPRMLEHQRLRWVTRDEMALLDFVAADRAWVAQFAGGDWAG